PRGQIGVRPRRGALVGACEEERAAAVNDREEVVEVVGYAAREPADRLHLLDLQERLLGLRHFLGGDLDLAEETRVLERGRRLRRERRRDRFVLFREAPRPARADREHT